MRVDFSTGEYVSSWKICPLALSQIRAIFRLLASEMRHETEWKKALQTLGVKSVGSVQIHLCEDLEMRAIQKQYRQLDRTTDVLSFPSVETPGIQNQFKILERADRSWGSLIISHPTVVRGAARGRRKVELEYLDVMIHGFLHLLGFDHVVGKGVSPSDAKRMKSLQASLFKKSKKLL